VLGVSTRTVLNRLRDLGVATRNVGANQWTWAAGDASTVGVFGWPAPQRSDRPTTEETVSTVELIYNRHVAEEKLKHGTKYERLPATRSLSCSSICRWDLRSR